MLAAHTSCILKEEIAEGGFAAAGHAEKKRVWHFAVVQVEVIRCAVVGFKNRQVFRVEMLIPSLARQNRE